MKFLATPKTGALPTDFFQNDQATQTRARIKAGHRTCVLGAATIGLEADALAAIQATGGVGGASRRGSITVSRAPRYLLMVPAPRISRTATPAKFRRHARRLTRQSARETLSWAEWENSRSAAKGEEKK